MKPGGSLEPDHESCFVCFVSQRKLQSLWRKDSATLRASESTVFYGLYRIPPVLTASKCILLVPLRIFLWLFTCERASCVFAHFLRALCECASCVFAHMFGAFFVSVCELLCVSCLTLPQWNIIIVLLVKMKKKLSKLYYWTVTMINHSDTWEATT